MTAAVYWVPAFAGMTFGVRGAFAPYSPSTALVMMLRWISLEPP